MDLFLFIILLSTARGLLAHPDGAPSGSCMDFEVGHGGGEESTVYNSYFVFSDAVNGYTPGNEYLGTFIKVLNTRGNISGFA